MPIMADVRRTFHEGKWEKRKAVCAWKTFIITSEDPKGNAVWRMNPGLTRKERFGRKWLWVDRFLLTRRYALPTAFDAEVDALCRAHDDFYNEAVGCVQRGVTALWHDLTAPAWLFVISATATASLLGAV